MGSHIYEDVSRALAATVRREEIAQKTICELKVLSSNNPIVEMW
jgi:hypothetical protein